MKINALVFAVFFSTAASAGDYALVVNSHTGVESLSIKQVRDIFLMKRRFANNKKLIPVNTSPSITIREEFEKKILKMNRDQLNNYWIKQHFQGVQPPIVQSSVKAMRLFIKNVNGAIGYLPKHMIDNDLRVVREF